jgi:hypothetical protein
MTLELHRREEMHLKTIRKSRSDPSDAVTIRFSINLAYRLLEEIKPDGQLVIRFPDGSERNVIII